MVENCLLMENDRLLMVYWWLRMVNNGEWWFINGLLMIKNGDMGGSLVMWHPQSSPYSLFQYASWSSMRTGWFGTVPPMTSDTSIPIGSMVLEYWHPHWDYLENYILESMYSNNSIQSCLPVLFVMSPRSVYRWLLCWTILLLPQNVLYIKHLTAIYHGSGRLLIYMKLKLTLKSGVLFITNTYIISSNTKNHSHVGSMVLEYWHLHLGIIWKITLL